MGLVQGRLYTEEIPGPDDCEVFTLKDFEENAQNGIFSNEDGSGYYAKNNRMCKTDEYFGSGAEDATHVIWFNK